MRRFAQPLGIHLDAWEGRIIETDKGIVRLLPVAERARQLFGDDGAAGLADRIERAPASARQLELFPAARERRGTAARAGRRRRFATAAAQSAVAQATTLDRVHAAMLLQAQRPDQRAARTARRRAGARPRFPASRQRAVRPLSAGLRGKAAAGCDAAGRAAVRWPRRLDDYEITSHAAFEMQRRGVAESVVRGVLAAPEQRYAVRPGRDVLQSRVAVAGKTYLVRVFVDIDRSPAEVVTVYVTSRVAKYWRAES